jgi:hypothetical protein
MKAVKLLQRFHLISLTLLLVVSLNLSDEVNISRSNSLWRERERESYKLIIYEGLS